MSGRKRICILAEDAYALITGKRDYFGGAEVQMSLLAKELTKRLYDVSLITFEKTNKFYEVSEGIKIFNAFYNRFGGYSYLLPKNIYKLIKILYKIDADIYIKKGHTPLTGVVAFLAKLQKKKFLFIASSDKDMDTHLNISSFFKITNIFFRFGVKYCSRVVCQTIHQKHLLQQNIGKNGIVIKSLYSLPKIEDNNRDSQSLKILWVGRLIKEKRPELFLDLAKKMPDYKFRIIITSSKSNQKYYDEFKKTAETIDNLDLIENVPYKEINRYYNESSILISTSISEGFPNTFLEAWGNAIPVVSLGFDPDEIICKYELGFHCKTFDDLMKDTRQLLDNEILRNNMGINARNYVLREHNVNIIIDEYEKLINDIIDIRE
jgi:glycosyltransferase involved in cell wall biosynthesis